MNISITVFTSTYNRGYILNNLYKSLQKQTFRSFEWIIIDDGSTDNTKDIISSWKKEKNDFEIRYLYTKNRGKHCAINSGVKLANSRLFFIVDSDDYLSENALERILYWEKTISDKQGFAGVSGNKCYFDKTLIGETFTGKYLDCTSLERTKFHIQGDKAEAYYTDILKKYPFPEFEGENFCSEALVWDRMSKDGYKIRYFNESIYFAEYREDGLSFNLKNKYLSNPKGTMLFFLERSLNNKNNFKEFLKNASFYYLYGNRFGYSYHELQQNLDINIVKSFMCIFSAFLRKNLKSQ